MSALVGARLKAAMSVRVMLAMLAWSGNVTSKMVPPVGGTSSSNGRATMELEETAAEQPRVKHCLERTQQRARNRCAEPAAETRPDDVTDYLARVHTTGVRPEKSDPPTPSSDLCSSTSERSVRLQGVRNLFLPSANLTKLEPDDFPTPTTRRSDFDSRLSLFLSLFWGCFALVTIPTLLKE